MAVAGCSDGGGAPPCSQGVLLHNLVTNMEEAIEGKQPGPSLFLYSGHDRWACGGGDEGVADLSRAQLRLPACLVSSLAPPLFACRSTVMPLLASLGLDLTHWPPYLSNLVFELWELPSGEHAVKVMYNLHDLQIPHCPPGECVLRCTTEAERS